MKSGALCRGTIILILAGAVALSPTGPSQAAPQAPAGVLRFSSFADPVLNPFTFPNRAPTILVTKLVFSTLTRYRPGDYQPVGDLASSWVAAEDGRIWVLKLRRGVAWHDGKPFTAADVKFTLEGIINPRVRANFRAALKGLQRVDAIDDYTVRLEFDAPVPSLPVLLAWNIPIAPRHLLDGKDLNDPTDFVQNPVGTGPFKFKEAVKGSHYTVEANASYYGGVPKLKTIVLKVIPDSNVVVAQLRTGELDLALVQPVDLEVLTRVSHVNLLKIPVTATFRIALNNSRWPFSERQVRQALLYGLDRDLMVKQILKGVGVLATGPYANAFGPFYNPKLKPYPHDLGKARQLLTEAGFRAGSDGVLQKDGKRLAFEIMVDQGNQTVEQVALFAQQSWKQLGVEVTIKVEEFAVLVRRLFSSDYDAHPYRLITRPDPDKTEEYTPGGFDNHYKYANPEITKLMTEARQTIDKQKRITLYRRIQEVLYDDVPELWIYYQVEVLAMNKRVHGYPNLNLNNGLQWMHLVSAD